MKSSIPLLKTLGICALLLFIFAFTSVKAKTIRVGSRDFPESVLSAEILSSAIEKYSDLKVDRNFNLGGVRINMAAMQSNNLDIYPDYTGSLLHNLLGEHSEKEYLSNYLKETLKNKYELSMSEPLGFDNSFVLAVRKDFAKKHKLEKISDLSKINPENLRVSFKHSFIKRPDGYEQIKKVYGYDFKNLRAMEYNIALQQLLAGRIDVIDSFSTDSRIKNPKLLTLRDDRKALLAYSSIYLSRNKILAKYPEIETILNSLSSSLTNDKMLKLNERIEKGETYKEVAADFLKELEASTNTFSKKRLLPNNQRSSKEKKSGIEARLSQDLPLVKKALLEHLCLSFLAAFLAALFGISLGVLITYKEKLAKIVLGISAVTQTIPSLALLALLIPIVGLGFYPALVALFVYALLPVIQNTYTGIKGIDNKYIELGKSLALSEKELLFKIKMPMAASVVIAGVKTSLVICIGTATLATFVGGGGLGDLIKAGIDLNSNYLICLGALPAAALALISNIALTKVEKAFTYKT